MGKIEKLETWWDEHPFFKRFYVPMVLTATFVTAVADILIGGNCK